MTFLRYAAASHAGFVRPNNEDSVYAGRTVLAVADGVGGAVAGEVAIRELAALDTPDREADVLHGLAWQAGASWADFCRPSVPRASATV